MFVLTTNILGTRCRQGNTRVECLAESNLHETSVLFKWYGWHKKIYELFHGTCNLFSSDLRRLMVYPDGMDRSGTLALQDKMPHMPRVAGREGYSTTHPSPPAMTTDAPDQHWDASGTVALKLTPEQRCAAIVHLCLAKPADLSFSYECPRISQPLRDTARTMLSQPSAQANSIAHAFVSAAHHHAGLAAHGHLITVQRSFTHCYWHGFMAAVQQRSDPAVLADLPTKALVAPVPLPGPAGAGEKRMPIAMRRVADMRGLPGREAVINYLPPAQAADISDGDSDAEQDFGCDPDELVEAPDDAGVEADGHGDGGAAQQQQVRPYYMVSATRCFLASVYGFAPPRHNMTCASLEAMSFACTCLLRCPAELLRAQAKYPKLAHSLH